jgi:hypothetical protein
MIMGEIDSRMEEINGSWRRFIKWGSRLIEGWYRLIGWRGRLIE